MNRIKLLIAPDAQQQLHQQQQQKFDKKLSHRIKRFSSERNLFFANIYSNNGPHGQTPQPLQPLPPLPPAHRTDRAADKPMSKLEKTKSFCLSGLKKCKSLRELYQQRGSQTNNSNNDDEQQDRKTFQHLDEFERNYLFSAGKRDLVRELRKNFEKQQPVATKATYRKCDFSELTNGDESLPSLDVSANKKRSLNACHSFNVTTTTAASMAHRGDAALHSSKHQSFGQTLCGSEPPSWTQSAMNLSTLTTTTTTMDGSSSDGSSSDQDKPDDLRSTAVLLKNMRNNSHRRANDGDTMSMCELNLYPVYMQNINDSNNLMATASRPDCDSGISINNIGNAVMMAPSSNGGKLKKYSSVNQIDLELLKSELDDFVGDVGTLSSWGGGGPWGMPAHHRGAAPYHHRSASSLVSTVRRKELDLEQKIDLEIKMREGSAKLLAACNNPKNQPKSTLGFSQSSASSPHNTQMLEAAKNLLTSNERMTGYMAELQRRKKERDALVGSPAPAANKVSGKVSLSEIRMPLMWRDSDHFKNKGDHRRFAVFCLVKIDTEIYDTSLLCPVDRNSTDISFNDAILFTKVSPDFELKLEVYSVMMESDLSIASTPRKIKNTIHSSISRTVGKRLAANLKDELNNTKIGPKFELIATATLTIDEASDLPHTHDLTINTAPATANSSNATPAAHPTSPTPGASLPLFGHFCCRLAVQPDAIETVAMSGALTLHAKGPTRPVEGHARLLAFRLELWDSEEACAAQMQPRRSVEVQRDAKVRHLRGDGETVADCVQLFIMEEGHIQEYTLHSDVGAAETQRWYAALKRCVREHSLWGHVTVGGAMQLAAPANMKGGFQRPALRHRSLYDQVPILENRQSNCSSRPVSHQEPPPPSSAAFAVPNSVDTSPTLNDFRLRANSSSGRSSSHSSSSISIGSIGSRKSHWPFGNNK